MVTISAMKNKILWIFTRSVEKQTVSMKKYSMLVEHSVEKCSMEECSMENKKNTELTERV